MPGISGKLLDTSLQPYEAFGRAVRKRRNQLQLTQDDLGERCEMDRTYISGIERGRGNQTIQVIWLLAEGLEMTPGDLVKEAERCLDEEFRQWRLFGSVRQIQKGD